MGVAERGSNRLGAMASLCIKSGRFLLGVMRGLLLRTTFKAQNALNDELIAKALE